MCSVIKGDMKTLPGLSLDCWLTLKLAESDVAGAKMVTLQTLQKLMKQILYHNDR